ncbi:Lrp/AsnC family transcriptional regulator [Streptomyces melanogenes]|uniref:Lrp/AsnC family transcriptional regulator n=1 Tax=Streptomyces melanogenes TaxID=67326 RepID=UPI00167E2115|nr:AsnC family transcriptional regulator [Streptomyces melanogenes]GGP58105.1 transcriptional regulator [Streptomyces melanogenes]
MDSPEFDELDQRLVSALVLDGRAPFSKIAAVLGVSDQTVARRYRRLYAEGELRVVGVRDTERLGHTRWMLRLRCTPDASVSIATALARRSDTAWIGLTSGGTEVVCTTESRRPEDYEALLLGKLPRTPSIVEIGAHQLLHRFYGGPLGWFTKDSALTAEERAALLPAPVDPSAPIRLDEEDDALIAALARNGRASYPELQKATGRSESAVKRRLDQLLRCGALFIDVEFDTTRFGFRTRALLWITVAPSALAAVGAALASHPEVAFAGATSGPANLVAVVICRDPAGLYTYLSEKLGTLEGVRHVETAPLLRQVKRLTYAG